MENNSVHRENERALTLLSVYLNLFPDCIDADMVNSITGGDESTRDYAFSVLMATACGLDTLSEAGVETADIQPWPSACDGGPCGR